MALRVERGKSNSASTCGNRRLLPKWMLLVRLVPHRKNGGCWTGARGRLKPLLVCNLAETGRQVRHLIRV